MAMRGDEQRRQVIGVEEGDRFGVIRVGQRDRGDEDVRIDQDQSRMPSRVSSIDA